MSKQLAVFCIFLAISAHGSSLRSVKTATEAITNAIELLNEPGQQMQAIADTTMRQTFHVQMGDMDDNDKTDENLLYEAKVPDEENTYKDISDIDDLELSEAVVESDNPVAAYSFKPEGHRPERHTAKNPTAGLMEILERDDDELPDDLDDHGDDNNDGDTQWVLVSSYQNDENSTGKVHAIPRHDSEQGFTLVSGLSHPIGMCFDVNHEFLYICDKVSDSKGYIYQYEIDWDDEDTFELRKPTYAVVYKGAPATSCSVDEYGNLFFATADDKISIASYLDLWSGFTNQHTTIYDSTSGKLSGITGIDVRNSEHVWFTNVETPESSGILNKASAQTTYLNSKDVHVEVSARTGAYGVGVSDDYAFFITNNQVFAYDFGDDEMYLKSIGYQEARGIAYGDNEIFISDHGTGEVYIIDADDGDQEFSKPWLRIAGAYAVHCINWSAQLLAIALFLLN